MATDPTLNSRSALRLAEFASQIKLKELLPNHLKFSETGDFVEFFETFLNELYYNEMSAVGRNEDYTVSTDGTKTYYATCADADGTIIYTSAGLPERYEITPADKVSILEKIRRIDDLHNPDWIDIDFIQRLANFMGYNIQITKDSIEESGLHITPTLTDDETNKYIRFLVSNIPNWYKLKSTKNAIKILLYSFGVVGQLIIRWTSDDLASSINHPQIGGYGNDESLWREFSPLLSASDAIALIPSNYFITPHFNIQINTVKTPASWFYNLNTIIDAIEDIRPINNVFDNIQLIFNDQMEQVYVRVDSYNTDKLVFPFNSVYPPIPE